MDTGIVCQYKLIKDLQAGNASAYEFLYKNYYPSIAYFIKRNKGNNSDAEDIFQEAVIILHQKLIHPGFHLSATLKTYLYGIARNLWLKKLRDNKLIPTDDNEQLMQLQDQVENSSSGALPENQPEEQVHAWLAEITGHCQHVLKSIYFEAQPINNLMANMGWKNRHTANNQKYKCIQQIKKVSAKGKGKS